MSVQNLNHVVITGNLTHDPELRSLPSGAIVCKLRVAVNTRRKDGQSGEWSDKANYFDVTVWGAQGENAARFLERGRGVGVQGRLEWREWETSEGGKRQAVEIIAENVQFLGAPPTTTNNGGGSRDREPAAGDAVAANTTSGNGHRGRRPASEPATVGAGADEDIPF